MSDLLAELAAIEARSAVDMTTAPSAAPVHMPEGVPGSTVNVTIGLDGAPISSQATNEGPVIDRQLQAYPDYVPPTAPIAPAPAAEVPAAPTAPESPEVRIPDAPVRRVYAHPGMTDENKLLLGLIDANPGLSMDAIMAAANTQLGRTAPALPVAQSPAQPSPSLPVSESPSFDTVTSRLDEIDAALQDLDPVVDANEWKKLTLEHNKLNRQLPALQVQQVQQQQTADQQIDALITETRNSVSQAYPTISPEVFSIIEDPSKPLSLIADPFAQAFAARYRQDQAAQSPLLEAADYESLVAASIAQQHGVLPAHLAGRQTAPVATLPGAQAPAPTAAPVQRPAQPTMQQPGLVPVTTMPSISGQQYTSPDRVTTQPVNPLANVQVEYQQALAASDFEAIERLSAVMATGGQAPQAAYPGGILGISYS
jgi:hypothetical protein